MTNPKSEFFDKSDEGKQAQEIIGDVDAKLLMKTLQTLPRRQRMALKLKVKGYSYREIGGKMEISINTVHNYLTLARKKLREILKSP